MTVIESCKILENEKLPIPAMQCISCQQTIWKKDQWFQCPDCGTRTTIYGGWFSGIPASNDWKAECTKAKTRLEELTNDPNS